MNNISQFEKCSGCGACQQICPTNAIRMSDRDLFFRPEVNERKCINCGKCVGVCPVNLPQQHQHLISAWAGIHNDSAVVKSSSSGGAFSALAQTILQEGGVIYGAVFKNHFSDVVICDTDSASLEEIRKSKYVESSTENSFQEVENMLQQGRKVLYCGAPCQIAGLKRYLSTDYETLITCDFTCGGMPSHRLYREWLTMLKKKYGAEVSYVDFRPKTLGWEKHAVLVKFENEKKYHSPARLDCYFNPFLYGHYSVRDLCLECPFSDNHYADIILADFWKHKDFAGFEKPGNGISLVLAGTHKGECLLKQAARYMKIQPLDLEKASYNIRKTEYVAETMVKRDSFWEAHEKHGLRGAFRTMCMPSLKKQWETRVKSAICYLLRSIR